MAARAAFTLPPLPYPAVRRAGAPSASPCMSPMAWIACKLWQCGAECRAEAAARCRRFAANPTTLAYYLALQDALEKKGMSKVGAGGGRQELLRSDG